MLKEELPRYVGDHCSLTSWEVLPPVNILYNQVREDLTGTVS
jgi:hypothetical protein